MDQKSQLINFWRENFGFREEEIDAFIEVSREDFVLGSFKHSAYDDIPLPLIRGKTISQPSTVMIMTWALELEQGEKIFEIGTGSGFHSAIISKIVGQKGKVISTEVIPELVMFARENLRKSNINNVFVYEEDGTNGMPNEAPFDKIIITSACREFPKPLLAQLKTEGIIVGPVGSMHEQEMVKGIKQKDGKLTLQFLGQFLFTPMYGKYGFVK
jgi:protein-L-isoaspartate(D-aspartate) O-methyltransferase